jgi:hypothetical protein
MTYRAIAPKKCCGLVNIFRTKMKPGLYLERAVHKPGKRRFNMLVAIPSPRDIPAFYQATRECLFDYDRFWVKHIPEEKEPYTIIKDYFLEHYKQRGYTHLAILPDDVIIHRQGVKRLVRVIGKNPDKYKVLMGTFNCEVGSAFVGACPNLPSLNRMTREHNFFWAKELEGKGIMQVGWCGTPLAIIRADLIVKGILSLQNDAKANNLYLGCCQDVVLANELAAHKIPLYIDTDVRFFHLKGSPEGEIHPELWDKPH